MLSFVVATAPTQKESEAGDSTTLPPEARTQLLLSIPDFFEPRKPNIKPSQLDELTFHPPSSLPRPPSRGHNEISSIISTLFDSLLPELDHFMVLRFSLSFSALSTRASRMDFPC
jgi:hypothetical protein